MKKLIQIQMLMKAVVILSFMTPTFLMYTMIASQQTQWYGLQ